MPVQSRYGISLNDENHAVRSTDCACDYLNCVGDAVVGWLHIRIAVEAIKKFNAAGTSEQDKTFYRGKIEGAKFFINRITGLFQQN